MVENQRIELWSTACKAIILATVLIPRIWWPQIDSNDQFQFRRLVLYPFHYVALWLRDLDSNQGTLRQELMRLPRMTTSQPRIIWWFSKDSNLELPPCRGDTLAN